MKQKCLDVFSKYDLPFETYFVSCIEHDEVIHQELELIWVIRGQAIIVCEGVTYQLNPNNLFMIFMNRKHSLKTTKSTILISYRLKQDYLKKHNLFSKKIPFKNRVYTFTELAYKYKQVPFLLIEILKLLTSPNVNPLQRYTIIAYYNIYVFNLYTSLIKDFYLDIKKPNYDIYMNRIQQIIDYTNKHYKEPISLAKLAKITNLSTYRLSHFINDTFGISYSAFVQHIRLEHALKLLRDSNYTITEIANKTGFSDHKYLSKIMKYRFEMTPFKYRKIIRKQNSSLTVPYNKKQYIQEIQTCLTKLLQDNNFKNFYEAYVAEN